MRNNGVRFMVLLLVPCLLDPLNAGLSNDSHLTIPKASPIFESTAGFVDQALMLPAVFARRTQMKTVLGLVLVIGGTRLAPPLWAQVHKEQEAKLDSQIAKDGEDLAGYTAKLNEATKTAEQNLQDFKSLQKRKLHSPEDVNRVVMNLVEAKKKLRELVDPYKMPYTISVDALKKQSEDETNRNMQIKSLSKNQRNEMAQKQADFAAALHKAKEKLAQCPDDPTSLEHDIHGWRGTPLPTFRSIPDTPIQTMPAPLDQSA
jgi:hypothetical protein